MPCLAAAGHADNVPQSAEHALNSPPERTIEPVEDLRIYRIDAFTTEPGQGNPAGVVSNASHLDEARMQSIAKALGHSETAFVLPPEDDGHDLRVRFFTPTHEVPVCGHATVGAHYALMLEGAAPGTRRQLTGAGVQAVETLYRGTDAAIRIVQNPPEFAPPLPPELARHVMAALGVSTGDLDFRCPMQVVSTGHGKLMVGLARRERLRGLQPDLERLAELSPQVGSNGYFVFTLDTGANDDAYSHGRMFAPVIGIDEDPVTGNANGPLGAYLVRHGLLATSDGSASFRARQRSGAGRHGYVDVDVRADHDGPVAVTIEGRAVLGERYLELPPVD